MKYFLNNSYALLQGTTDSSDGLICPSKLYLDITQDCNLWCRMCREQRSVSGRTMPFDLFRRLVDETAPYVRSYSLFNWGEPLMVQDFRERVRYVNRKKRDDCVVEISTNGMLLDEAMISFLHTEQVSLVVSVDAADKETFTAIRRGADFARIMRQAKNAAAVYQDFPLQQTPGFYISIQKENQHRLLPIAQMACKLGIQRIGCGLVIQPETYAPSQDKALCQELERTFSFIKEQGMFLELFPTKVGSFVLDGDVYRAAADYIVSTTCQAPLVSATIDYSGDVYLCCNVGDFVGNVSDSSFLELWQSEQYTRKRRAVNQLQECPQSCRSCAWVNRN